MFVALLLCGLSLAYEPPRYYTADVDGYATVPTDDCNKYHWIFRKGYPIRIHTGDVTQDVEFGKLVISRDSWTKDYHAIRMHDWVLTLEESAPRLWQICAYRLDKQVYEKHHVRAYTIVQQSQWPFDERGKMWPQYNWAYIDGEAHKFERLLSIFIARVLEHAWAPMYLPRGAVYSYSVPE